MNPAMFITVIYIGFSILVIYIVARPSNRKRVLRWSLGHSRTGVPGVGVLEVEEPEGMSGK